VVLVAGSVAPLRAQTAATAPAPIVWPLTENVGGGKVELWEPQVRSWPDYAQMTGIAAIAVTLPGTTTPVYGTLSFSSLASADVPSGMVSLVNPKVTKTEWSTATASTATALDTFLKTNVQLKGKPFLPLAMVLSSLPKAERPKTSPVSTTPPLIYVNQTAAPAVLVVFDGKPAFAPIPGTALTYAINTNWEIVHDPQAQLYYVHAKAGWFSAGGAAGPFTPTVAPASFAAIPASGRFAGMHAALHAPKPAPVNVSRVIVSDAPAELINIAGPPQFANIAGTQLRYVSNTSSDVFFSRETTVWYVLLSGRWFSAANLNGPWTFASVSLPTDFKKIPEDSPRGRVLVSVPGTTQAFYAAGEAQVPRITPADPSTLHLNVTYAGGAPAFAPIPQTAPLRYAQNASTDVIEVDATHYFACDHGVWFEAAAATGPWLPASYVPEIIYTIPASAPLYHVTFVHVYNADGIAMTAPVATPAPRPGATYEKIAPSQLSNGDIAAYANTYYYGGSVQYLGGYAPAWGGYAYGTGYYNPGYIGVSTYILNPPTYGNYSDTTFAREREQSAAGNNPRQITPAQAAVPEHGPRIQQGPNTNIYAADDGVYRYTQGAWQKNAGGEDWQSASTYPPTLDHDRKARRDGYNGEVS
jgi:hypothetical protein